jgi:pimeloyl-ACP methyl ester carboxylesterase
VPPGLSTDDAYAIWRAIKCPVWLVHGAESFAPHPGDDGHAGLFSQPRVTSYAEAGHWVHHDRLDAFTADLRAFLG